MLSPDQRKPQSWCRRQSGTPSYRRLLCDSYSNRLQRALPFSSPCSAAHQRTATASIASPRLTAVSPAKTSLSLRWPASARAFYSRLCRSTSLHTTTAPPFCSLYQPLSLCSLRGSVRPTSTSRAPSSTHSASSYAVLFQPSQAAAAQASCKPLQSAAPHAQSCARLPCVRSCCLTCRPALAASAAPPQQQSQPYTLLNALLSVHDAAHAAPPPSQHSPSLRRNSWQTSTISMGMTQYHGHSLSATANHCRFNAGLMLSSPCRSRHLPDSGRHQHHAGATAPLLPVAEPGAPAARPAALSFPVSSSLSSLRFDHIGSPHTPTDTNAGVVLGIQKMLTRSPTHIGVQLLCGPSAAAPSLSPRARDAAQLGPSEEPLPTKPEIAAAQLGPPQEPLLTKPETAATQLGLTPEPSSISQRQLQRSLGLPQSPHRSARDSCSAAWASPRAPTDKARDSCNAAWAYPRALIDQPEIAQSSLGLTQSPY